MEREGVGWADEGSWCLGLDVSAECDWWQECQCMRARKSDVVRDCGCSTGLYSTDMLLARFRKHIIRLRWTDRSFGALPNSPARHRDCSDNTPAIVLHLHHRSLPLIPGTLIPLKSEARSNGITRHL